MQAPQKTLALSVALVDDRAYIEGGIDRAVQCCPRGERT